MSVCNKCHGSSFSSCQDITLEVTNFKLMERLIVDDRGHELGTMNVFFLQS